MENMFVAKELAYYVFIPERFLAYNAFFLVVSVFFHVLFEIARDDVGQKIAFNAAKELFLLFGLFGLFIFLVNLKESGSTASVLQSVRINGHRVFTFCFILVRQLLSKRCRVR